MEKEARRVGEVTIVVHQVSDLTPVVELFVFGFLACFFSSKWVIRIEIFG